MVIIATGALGLWLTAPSLVLGLVALAVLGSLASHECGSTVGPHGDQGHRRSWSTAQTANARLIISTVAHRGLPRRAAVLALATAIAESRLRNLHSGDRDSLGVFQQRPSQGWGRPTQLLDPSYATGQFLHHLLALPRWAHLAPGVAEQLVQRSAHPDGYAPHENAAADLVARYWPSPFSDSPPPPGGTPMTLAAFTLTPCPGHTTPALAGPPPTYPGNTPADPHARTALTYALKQLGKPYMWGAAGPNAFDCSGLVQASWATAGVTLGRTTIDQIHDGTPIADWRQLQPGDLLFIPGDEGTRSQPRHVGLFAGHGQVIDAYGSHRGIVLEPLTKWLPEIVAIRRVSPTHPPAAGR